jgi:hypothetical protein
MKRLNRKNKNTLNITVLSCCLLLVAICFFINIDRTAENIVGPKWHFRSLDQKYQKTKNLYNLLISMAMVTKGRFERAVDRHPLGPIVLAFIILEILYRIYAIKKKGTIAKKVRKIHFNLVVVITAAIIIYAVWDIWIRG